MAALAIGIVWIGYATGFWGYCLIRGYNVTPKQMLSPSWPPGSTKGTPAPSTSNKAPGNPSQQGGAIVGGQTGTAIGAVTGK